MNNDKRPDDYLLGNKSILISGDLQDGIAWKDHKIKFCLNHVKNKNVLDIGCVHHNPENYRSRYWLHKALVAEAKSVTGIDLYEPGVAYLNEIGYKVQVENAECFDLGEKFDVVVAGDVIEHLNNIGGFFQSCRLSLHSGGKLLISTPNPWYWRNVAKAALMAHVKPNPEHTLWMCPDTLRQIADRYGFQVSGITFGSRYLRDKIVPLPKGIKHTSFHAVLE